MIKNISLIFRSYIYTSIFVISFLALFFLWYIFFDYELSIGNLWVARTYIGIFANIIFSLLFALFISGQVYKIREFKKVGNNSGQWLVWWILGSIFVWCPSCTISIASYVGLSGLLSLLPWGWMEVKLLAILLLLWSNYKIYKTLLTCNIGKK